MFTITKKPKTANMLWDAEHNKPLCQFDENGLLVTDDAALADKLKGLGYNVEGEKPLEKMTVAELKEYAAVHEIDISEAAKKEEILAAIQAVGNA